MSTNRASNPRPHAATLPRGTAAQPKLAKVEPGPHAATVARGTAVQAKVAKEAPGPHLATVAWGKAVQPLMVKAVPGPHAATVAIERTQHTTTAQLKETLHLATVVQKKSATLPATVRHQERARPPGPLALQLSRSEDVEPPKKRQRRRAARDAAAAAQDEAPQAPAPAAEAAAAAPGIRAEGRVRKKTARYADELDRKTEWKRGRTAYINMIRRKTTIEGLVQDRGFGALALAITTSGGQSTVAVAVDDNSNRIYIGVQDGADIDEQSIRRQLKKLKGKEAPYTYQIVGGAESTLHAEMQIIKHFLDKNETPPKLHFAANGKGCCNCCAGMIAALGGTCEKVEYSSYEYVWTDPYWFHSDLRHPVFGENATSRIVEYGKDIALNHPN